MASMIRIGSCGVCLEDGVRGVACSAQARHIICAECAPREVQRVLQDLHEPTPLERFRRRGGRIKCVQDGCTATYSDEFLAPLLPASTSQNYRREQADVARYYRDQAQQDGGRGRQSEETATAQYLRDHYRNAVQCPRCGAGPVIPEQCADLQAHHGEELSRGGRISNACPSCGFFSRNRGDWTSWDGRLRPSQDDTALARAARATIPVSPSRIGEGLSRERQQMLRVLMNVCGIEDPALAHRLLQENSWQLDASVNSYLDRNPRDGRVRPVANSVGTGVYLVALLLLLVAFRVSPYFDIAMTLALPLFQKVPIPPSGKLAYALSAAAPLEELLFVVGVPMRLELQPGLVPGKPRTSFRASNLPKGLAIDNKTGVISGTAVTASRGYVTVSAFTPGAVGGPTTTFELNVGLFYNVAADAVMKGIGVMAVGALYWLVTQND